MALIDHNKYFTATTSLSWHDKANGLATQNHFVTKYKSPHNILKSVLFLFQTKHSVEFFNLCLKIIHLFGNSCNWAQVNVLK